MGSSSIDAETETPSDAARNEPMPIKADFLLSVSIWGSSFMYQMWDNYKPEKLVSGYPIGL
ncbi:MAG: hypothetical protein F4X44_01880 [Gammaproteobacteria bacterium]|nr:hypothetical protein [Gammaproteobacteria bacterium]